ncbi:hypothetical protein JL721_1159 [Aureococcus anophagefferens]|nr:hypothetical protein JL721_1159 [Aureococcus anophagefferens]
MSETSTKRNFGPAWRKDGGTFGAPVKAPSPVENGHGTAARRRRSAVRRRSRRPAPGGRHAWNGTRDHRGPARPRGVSNAESQGSEASGPKAPPVRKAPGVTFTKSQLLGLRQPTVLLESMRAALPREITSAEPLAPCSSGRRPTTEQIGAAWQAAARKEEGSDAPKDKGPRAPRDPPPGGKDRTGPGSAASFEAEMRAMREKGGGQLPGGDLGTPDMFGAAFSGDADGADIDKAAREERARAAKALESLEAAASAPPPAPGLAAPARKDDDDGSWRVKPWFYKDPQGQHQGPFEAPQMRQWFNAGYFDDDLPLRQGESGDFVPLGRLFSSPQDAFVTKPLLPAPPKPPGMAPPAFAQPAARRRRPSGAAGPGRRARGFALAAGAREPRAMAVRRRPRPDAALSLKEIQQQEAARAEQQRLQQAQRAAAATRAAAAPQPPAAEPMARARAAARPPARGQARGRARGVARAVVGAAAAAEPARGRARGARGAAGRGQVGLRRARRDAEPDALQTWCKTQLKKINGSDDITLIQFCMTLTDNSEIRQYLSMYLGSTPQVAAFANEFIKRKQGKVPAAAAAAPAPAPKQQAAHSDAPQAQGASSKSRRRGRRAKAGA